MDFNNILKFKNIRNVIFRSLAVILILIPIILGLYMCYRIYDDIGEVTLNRREAVAHLVSTIIHERLDRVVDLGVSLATRPVFVDLIENGKWSDAMLLMAEVPESFHYIERVAFFNKNGDLIGSVPSSPEIESVVGDNFAFRDYYKGVSKNWEPYVASIIKPVVPIGYNIVPVAIPIKTRNNEVLGFIMLHLKLDTIHKWVSDLKLDDTGSISIVDRSGILVIKSDEPISRDLVDLSSDAVVSRVLSRQSGIEEVHDKEDGLDRLVTYMYVENYDWGVIISQASNLAFVERDRTVIFFGSLWIFSVLTIGTCLYLIIRDRNDLKSQRDKEKILMDSIGDGVVAIDRNFKIVSWNKAASQLSGWEASEAIGKQLQSILKFVRASDMTDDIVFIEEVMLFGEARTMNPNTLLIRKDNSSLPVSDSAAPIFDESGSTVGAIVIFRDASKEREIQRARDLIILKTIHDLRAPVTAIKLVTEEYSDIKTLKSSQKLLKESIELIKNANSRMLALINSLLDEASKNYSEHKQQKIEIKDVIVQIIREMSPVAKKKKVSINFDMSLPMTFVSISAERLKEIFSNLLDNAIKYNKEEGRVDISYSIDKDFVAIVISDTGMGVSEVDLADIFTPFKRFAKTIEGTGLGLSIVKKIIEDEGGQIKCTSKLGVGTTFEIKLKKA